jgi:hypothetical protein
MTAIELVAKLTARGVKLTLDGDDVVIDAPPNVLNDEIVQAIRAAKPELVRALRSQPTSCRRCGCALGWRTTDGRVACAECEPKPPAADMLVLVDTNAGPVWRRYDDERPVNVQPVDGPDPWDEAIPWGDTTPTCPKCNSAEGWVDALDHWHCWKCTPPFRTEKLLNDRERLLRTAWRKSRRRQGGRES